MSTYSSSAPNSSSRSLAASVLRSTGLMDKDTPMRDADKDKQGGRKGTVKSTRARRTRATESPKDQTIGNATHRPHATRLAPLYAGADPYARPGVRVSGRSIKGAPKIIPSTVTHTSPRFGTVELWRQLVNRRYDPNARFLNLESLIEDETVKQHNLTPPGYGGTSKDAAVIFKLASQLQPEVETLSLANNRLTGQHLTFLDKYLPRLRNLSLQNNALKTWRDLDYIGARKDKLKHLRELVLLGTPLRDMEYKNGRGDRYRSEIARRFLSLEVLDQETVTQIGFTTDSVPGAVIEQVPKPHATTFPYEMGPSFVTGVNAGFVSEFLLRFFALFDSQRSSLVDVYDPAAVFSYSCNTSIPSRARIEGLFTTMPNQKKLAWDTWLNNSAGGSRNLNRQRLGLERTIDILHVGPENIVKAQAVLPQTQHDLQNGGDKFVLDSFPVPHGQSTALMVTVHGEFMEVDTKGMRSFDRTFILLPSAEGSKAKMAGWGAVILSDQWTIRGYSNPVAWKPGPLLVQAEPKPSAPKQEEFSILMLPIDQQQALGTMPEEQRNLVLQVCARTRLNFNFAVQCLVENQWKLDMAIANFERVKATLPPGAFL